MNNHGKIDRIPRFGAVPLVLAVVICLQTQNVEALPQFGGFPGEIIESHFDKVIIC